MKAWILWVMTVSYTHLFATMALPADNLIQSISIVPCPERITPGTGYFTFSGKTDFTVENEAVSYTHLMVGVGVWAETLVSINQKLVTWVLHRQILEP